MSSNKIIEGVTDFVQYSTLFRYILFIVISLSWDEHIHIYEQRNEAIGASSLGTKYFLEEDFTRPFEDSDIAYLASIALREPTWPCSTR